MNFKDKVFLITGSTSGIGQGIAKALLEEEANIKKIEDAKNYKYCIKIRNETNGRFCSLLYK